jgi:hypothetical protein
VPLTAEANRSRSDMSKEYLSKHEHMKLTVNQKAKEITRGFSELEIKEVREQIDLLVTHRIPMFLLLLKE